jgi:hypothetical protein
MRDGGYLSSARRYELPPTQGAAALAGGTPSALEVFRTYDLRRRARLVGIVTLGVLVPVLLLVPSTLVPSFDIVSLVSLCIALVGTLVAFGLNRFGRVGPAGYVLLFGIMAGIAWDIVGKAHSQGGVDLGDLRLYDLLAIPILLSGVLLSRRGPVILASITATFTTASLILLPKTPPLQQYWDGTYTYVLGSLYDVIAIAVLIQLLTAVVAWLGADGMRRALMEASRADELEAANARNVAQAQQLAQQRRHLQQGIQEIQQVHSAVARGHWEARARVGEGELLPVAMSLNLLLDRLTRLTREQEQRTRMEAAARELATALRRARAGEPYMPPSYTGTVLDDVLVELSTLRPQQLGGGEAASNGPALPARVGLGGEPRGPGAPSLNGGNGWPDGARGASAPSVLPGTADAARWPDLSAPSDSDNSHDDQPYLPEWLRGGNW